MICQIAEIYDNKTERLSNKYNTVINQMSKTNSFLFICNIEYIDHTNK